MRLRALRSNGLLRTLLAAWRITVLAMGSLPGLPVPSAGWGKTRPTYVMVPGLVLLAAGAAQAQASAAETGVRDVLQRYSAALESLDAEAVKKVQPSIPTDSLAKAFREMRELKVVIDAVRVLSIDGRAARVSFRVTQTLTPKAGSKQTTAVTRVMRLRQESGSWVIEGFER